MGSTFAARLHHRRNLASSRMLSRHQSEVRNSPLVTATELVSLRSGLINSSRTLGLPLARSRRWHSATLLPAVGTFSIFWIIIPVDRPACDAGDLGKTFVTRSVWVCLCFSRSLALECTPPAGEYT